MCCIFQQHTPVHIEIMISDLCNELKIRDHYYRYAEFATFISAPLVLASRTTE